jgi:hypothetical protein
VRRGILFVIPKVYSKRDLHIILYENTELSIDENRDIVCAVQVFL